jgi:O-antigen/teichoic acid export membrane protein
LSKFSQPGQFEGEIIDDAQGELNETASVAVAQRKQRQQRITLAWSTSLISKVATVGVQLIAVPLVFRALGEGGYAAYAVVTSSASLIAVLSLGIGGSLVTPIAEAVAESDHCKQALLMQAGLGPLVLLCILGSLAVIPLVAFLPLSTLFGRVGVTGSWDLRTAALIAASATLAWVPLSSITFLRQAYQEMHVTHLLGAASSLLLCAALMVAAKRSTSVTIFVAVFMLIPLGASALNFGWLFLQRPYLLRSQGFRAWKDNKHLLADGIRYMGAGLSSVLLYQWPVYWVGRVMPSSTSSWFAVCMQAVVLPMGSVFGLLMPLWPSIADAVARSDHHWLDGAMKKGRVVAAAVGGCAFLTALIFGEQLLHLWLRKPVILSWQVRGLMGVYVLLAIWEYYYFMLALGFGQLREAASAIFHRSLAFSIVVPLLTALGGVTALWCGMCCSILFWTAWRLPSMLNVPGAQDTPRMIPSRRPARKHR